MATMADIVMTIVMTTPAAIAMILALLDTAITITRLEIKFIFLLGIVASYY